MLVNENKSPSIIASKNPHPSVIAAQLTNGSRIVNVNGNSNGGPSKKAQQHPNSLLQAIQAVNNAKK